MSRENNRYNLVEKSKFLLFNLIYLLLVFSLMRCGLPANESDEGEVHTIEGVHNVKPLELREKLVHNHFSDLIGDRRTALLLIKYADRYELDLYLLYAMIKVESSFDSYKITRKGSRGLRVGLCQLDPDLFKELDIKELIDEEVNISRGSALLKEALEKYGGNPVLALASFREGKSKIVKKQLGKETLDYIQAIFIEQERIKESVELYLKEHEYLF